MFAKKYEVDTQKNTKSIHKRWFRLLPFIFYFLPVFFTCCKKEKIPVAVSEAKEEITTVNKTKEKIVSIDNSKKRIDYGTFYTDGLSSKKWVALTFDDGPKPEVLDKILKVLKDENVKATFFIVGVNTKRYPQSVNKYLQAGHEIGNHTYSHKNYYQLKEKKSIEEVEKILIKELISTEDTIHELANIKPFFMRMPNGFISPVVRKVAKEKKYVIVNWTFGCDWQKNTKEEIVEKYLKNVEPGTIFLFHEKKSTAQALSEIIKGIKKKGYEIVSLREILEIDADGCRLSE
ncbi:MAG: polysaccharide deacetylase family protein [Elusimicrobiota bacterium]